MLAIIHLPFSTFALQHLPFLKFQRLPFVDGRGFDPARVENFLNRPKKFSTLAGSNPLFFYLDEPVNSRCIFNLLVKKYKREALEVKNRPSGTSLYQTSWIFYEQMAFVEAAYNDSTM